MDKLKQTDMKQNPTNSPAQIGGGGKNTLNNLSGENALQERRAL
jgi:hypothetical protein